MEGALLDLASAVRRADPVAAEAALLVWRARSASETGGARAALIARGVADIRAQRWGAVAALHLKLLDLTRLQNDGKSPSDLEKAAAWLWERTPIVAWSRLVQSAGQSAEAIASSAYWPYLLLVLGAAAAVGMYGAANSK